MRASYTADQFARHAAKFGDPRTVYETAIEEGLSALKLLRLAEALRELEPAWYWAGAERRTKSRDPRFRLREGERLDLALRLIESGMPEHRVYKRLGINQSQAKNRLGKGITPEPQKGGPDGQAGRGFFEQKSPDRPPSPALGERFGRLVVERAIRRDDGRTWLLCNCDCGGSTLAKPSHLRRGEVVSCGCKRREDTVGRLRLFRDGGAMTHLGHALLDSLDPDDLAQLAELIAPYLGRPDPAGDEWLDSKGAAAYVGLTLDALHKRTGDRTIPFHQERTGAKCWFRKSELDAWRERDRVKPVDTSACLRV